MNRIGMAVGYLVAFLGLQAVQADDWPQWLGPQRDGVWREAGLVDEMPASPTYKWRQKIGSGYAGPAVVQGKVYVTDRLLAPQSKNPVSAFARTEVKGAERVHRLDAATGAIEWTHSYDSNYRISYASGPRCTPVVTDNRVYTLGAMGQLYCLDATNGKPVWQKDLREEYSAPEQYWGFSAHPLLDGDKLICLVGGDAAVVAFHKDTGKEIWRSMEVRFAGYSPPMIFNVGNSRQLIVWTSENVNGLDPESGKVLWSEAFGPLKASLSIPTPQFDGQRLFVTSFYDGPMMLKLSTEPIGAQVLWRGKSKSEQPDKTDKLHSIMPTPVLKGGHIYGVCSYGQLRCLKADTGERVWESMEATRQKVDGEMKPNKTTPLQSERWGNAFLTPQADRYWLFNEHGDLILAKLSPNSYTELGRMKIIEPDNQMAQHPVVWSHPAYANKCCFVRNDSEIVCVDLAAK